MIKTENYINNQNIEPYDINMGFDCDDFDFNAAFQEALYGVMSDKELALEEKVKRMEFIVTEGTSLIYREFIDFRAMAAQIQMMCNHDHAMKDFLSNSDVLTGLLSDSQDNSFNKDHNHDHDHKKLNTEEIDEEDDEDEDGMLKTKKKKRTNWLDFFVKSKKLEL